MTPALLNDDISPQSYLRDQLQEKDQRSKIREEILEQKLKDDKKGEITYLRVCYHSVVDFPDSQLTIVLIVFLSS